MHFVLSAVSFHTPLANLVMSPGSILITLKMCATLYFCWLFSSRDILTWIVCIRLYPASCQCLQCKCSQRIRCSQTATMQLQIISPLLGLVTTRIKPGGSACFSRSPFSRWHFNQVTVGRWTYSKGISGGFSVDLWFWVENSVLTLLNIRN